MNNGRIKALDIECFINGGCTLDDSEQVRASDTSDLGREQNIELLDESLLNTLPQVLTRFHSSSTFRKKKKMFIQYM